MPTMPGQTVTTAEQLFALREPGFHHELVAGELRRMSPVGPVHGIVTMRLARRLANQVEENDLGAVFGAESGFVLARNPDTVLAPDIAFVRKTRLLTQYPPGFFPGPPDLAVEVIAPGDPSPRFLRRHTDGSHTGLGSCGSSTRSFVASMSIARARASVASVSATSCVVASWCPDSRLRLASCFLPDRREPGSAPPSA